MRACIAASLAAPVLRDCFHFNCAANAFSGVLPLSIPYESLSPLSFSPARLNYRTTRRSSLSIRSVHRPRAFAHARITQSLLSLLLAMKPPFPSPTTKWHNDVYPAIDATSPNLNHAGQTIVVTGAVGGPFRPPPILRYGQHVLTQSREG